MLGDTRRKILRFGATGFAVAALTVAVGLPAFAANNTNNNDTRGISANVAAQIQGIKSKTGNSARQGQDSKQIQVNKPEQDSDQDNHQKAIVPTSGKALNINKSGDAVASGASSDIHAFSLQHSSADAKGKAIAKSDTGNTGGNHAGGNTSADGGSIEQASIPINAAVSVSGDSDASTSSGDSKAVNPTGDADGGKGVGISHNDADGGIGGDTGNNDPDSSGNNTATNIGALLGSASSGDTGNSSDVTSGPGGASGAVNGSSNAANGGAGGSTGGNSAASDSTNNGAANSGSNAGSIGGTNGASTNLAKGANGGQGGSIAAAGGVSGANSTTAALAGGNSANGLAIIAPVNGTATASSGAATNNGDASSDPCVVVDLNNQPTNNQDQNNQLDANSGQGQDSAQGASSTNTGTSQDAGQGSSNDSSVSGSDSH